MTDRPAPLHARPIARARPLPLLLLAWLLLAMPLAAQQPQPGDEPTAAPEAGISLETLPQRLQADRDFIERVIDGVDDASRSPLDEDLGRLEGEVAALSERSHRRALKTLAMPALISLDRHWRFTARQIEQLGQAAEEEVLPIAQDTEAVRATQRLWRGVAEQGALSSQSVTSSHVLELVRDAERAERLLARPFDQGVALAQRTTALRSEAERARLAVHRELARRDRGLLRIDSAPLWEASAWRLDAKGEVGFGGVELAFVRAYESAAHPARTLVLAALLLALPLVGIASRGLRARMLAHPELSPFRSTLLRPWSALALVGVVALLFTQLGGPQLHLNVLLLAALFPAMRLQPPAVRALFGRWFYLGGLLYLLHVATAVLPSDAPLHRLLVGVSSIAALAGLAWWRLRHPPGTDTPGHRAAWLRTLVGVFAVVAIVSLVANVVGNVTLASVLADGVIHGLYVGLLVFAAVHVFDALWALATAHGLKALGSVAKQTGALFNTLSRVARYALAAAWALSTLAAFRVLGPLGRFLSDVGQWSVSVGEVAISLKGVAVFVATVAFAFWFASTLRKVLAIDLLPTIRLPRGVGNSIATLAYYAVLMVGLGVALSAAGFELSQLTLVLGALGVGLGLGLQDVVRNFVSGLILMVERPIQPGDIVDLEGSLGKVREIGMRATTLSTYEGAEIVVPNGLLIANKMTNWTLNNERRRVDLSVGVAYGSDPRTVIDLLRETINRVPGVQQHPAASVLFQGFGESALMFDIRAWTANAEDAAILRSEVGLAVHDALRKAGLEIPFPQRDVHLRGWTPTSAVPDEPSNNT